MSLLGRVLDGNGQPLDGMGALHTDEQASRHSPAINPLARRAITEPLDVGVRAINAMLTVGKGQRMGLFAGSGVGKSVLLGMMTRGTTADIIVVGLVGERGREVKEFIEEILGAEGRARSVVIAAPADTSPLMRLRACETSTRIAEYFRDLGYDVLLLMDSLTRYARHSGKLPWRSVSRRQPRGIRLQYLPSCPVWWSAPVMVVKVRARSLPSILCLPKGTISKIPLPMPRGPFWTAT